MGLDREILNQRKIARTLIRLRKSLEADEEIRDYLEQERDVLTGGALPKIDTTLKELLGKS